MPLAHQPIHPPLLYQFRPVPSSMSSPLHPSALAHFLTPSPSNTPSFTTLSGQEMCSWT